MSRENVTFDWLIARVPAGVIVSATATNDDRVSAGFIRAHQQSGHLIERLSYLEACERFRASRAPARERYYAEQPAALTPGPIVPAIGERVQVELGQGTVIAHLRWSEHHRTHAGQVAALVRGIGFEGLAYSGQATVIRSPLPAPPLPADPAPSQLTRPQTTQPSLF